MRNQLNSAAVKLLDQSQGYGSSHKLSTSSSKTVFPLSWDKASTSSMKGVVTHFVRSKSRSVAPNLRSV